MRLKVTLLRPSGHVDVVATVDPTTTVGDLADALQSRDPQGVSNWSGAAITLGVHSATGVTPIPPAAEVGSAGLRSGAVVSVADASSVPLGAVSSGPAATLRVVAGPDSGRTFSLQPGRSLVGRARACDVKLTDPLVSKQHVRVTVGPSIEVVDERSSNGVYVGEERVARAVIGVDEPVTIGETVFVVSGLTAGGLEASSTVEFNRSPRVAPNFPGEKRTCPDPPQPPQRQRFPILSMLAPAVMGVLFFAITRNVASVAFIALSPLMMAGSYIEGKRAGRATFKEATDQFHASLADLSVDLQADNEAEGVARRAEHPSSSEMVDAILRLSPLVWTRRPEHEHFLTVALGLGTQPSRNTVELPSSRNTTPELWREVQAVADRFATVDRVPVVASFRECGSLGLGGPRDVLQEVANGVVAQLVGLHSPAELVLCGLAPAANAGEWEWLKWLPHTSVEGAVTFSSQLTSSPPACGVLVAELEDLIVERLESAEHGDGPPLPAVVVLIEDQTPVERSRLVGLAERGPQAGVHVLWIAPSVERIPAACRVFLSLDPQSGAASSGHVIEGKSTSPVTVSRVDPIQSEHVGRQLSPVVDSGASTDAASDLPSTVSFLAEAGVELATSTQAVLERWDASFSMPIPADLVGVKLRRDQGLRALVGRSNTDAFHLDLRTQGPHALVGGTTGAGKSEFLQTWILGMAAGNSPLRVTFLFVDYKGGAAFADCLHLPHCVGLVTDLSPHLVQRALTSLNAELRHREHLLNRKKAKDLLELERRRDPEAPPGLVIVVDEFAALVAEVPEFVDGVVNVAQRGRSLGLHLILATQRPAGVIKDNLRANTNLRIALRMADEDDSSDVVGTPLAATFDPALPGRAIAKTGPGRLTPFQAGYVGGWTAANPPPPPLAIRELGFGVDTEWEPRDAIDEAPVDDPGPNDIARVVAAISAASKEAGIEAPRKPWLPELASLYELAELPTARRDDDLVFGVLDSPATQTQPVVSFQPDRDGNMAVIGTGGSGKSAFLRTVAVAAGLTARGGPCVVYGLDFAGRGLDVLESLPHVGSVIAGEDSERVARLMKQLRETIDQRAVDYARVRAGTIEEYRRLASRPDEARVLLLVDNVGAFRQAYEAAIGQRVWDTFCSIASDGRAVGVHVIVAADRPGSISAALGSAIQQRLVLRLAGEMDLMMAGVPADGFAADSPPGRGFIGDAEVQVAVLGGTQNVAAQGQAIERLAVAMEKAGVQRAPEIERLAERVTLTSLPPTVEGRPTLGLFDETLGPIGFVPEGVFLVTGPPQSGRTTALATIALSLQRADPSMRLYYFGTPRSPLPAMVPWAGAAIDDEEIEKLAGEVTTAVQDASAPGVAVFVEDVPSFLNGPSDYVLQEMLGACKTAGAFVVGEGESGSVNGSWPLLQLVRSGRQGIALQPDQTVGDFLFQTPFPRVARADFPPGRGMYVRGGKAFRVQVAVPE